jgi:CheY-like chemotaxis protein
MEGVLSEDPTILYVDDQPSHLALFKKAFQADYLVLTAASGEEGLQMARDHEPFLVIADHNMPQMTGIDFLQKVTHLSPRSVRMILSAYLNDAIVKDASEKAQVMGHLKKPWRLDQMRAIVSEAFKSYREGIIPSEERSWNPSVRELDWERVFLLMEEIGDRVDPRGARRIFLQFVEPPLKKFVPLIHRPQPAILQQARQEALKGNFETVQKILAAYLLDVRST